MKKWVKILLWVLGGVISVFLILFGYGYYQFWGKFEVDKNKYSKNVEYIDPEKALFNEGFQVCNEDKIGQYYNLNQATYSKGKNGLRTCILSNYVNKGYNSSGYLNIRFIINCKGETGRYIIHENNLDLEPTQLDKEMVTQLFELTRRLKKWNPIRSKEKTWDSYMYISYRIENGEIIEILP